jgi:hypothetical protein
VRSLREVKASTNHKSTNLRYRYSLEIRHTRAHVPLFRLSLTALSPAVMPESGKRDLLIYNKSLDASRDGVFLMKRF